VGGKDLEGRKNSLGENLKPSGETLDGLQIEKRGGKKFQWGI